MSATMINAPTALAASNRISTTKVNPLRQTAMALPMRKAKNIARMPAMAALSTKQQDGFVQFANSIGLPTDEGLFGFRPFSELWVGRLAMMGFITSIVEEFWTGKGTLAQIGFTDLPDNTVLIALATLATVATLAGTAKTLVDARNGKLTKRDLARYRNFLGMTNEAANIKATQKAMKMEGDFTSPDNFSAIEAAKREGTPADTFLAADNMAAVQQTADELKKNDNVFALNDVAAADAEAAAMKKREQPGQVGPSVSLAAEADVKEQMVFSATANDFDYAKQVEIEQGRYAMLGFLAAILVEASTGNGIIMQCINYLKWSGILGPMSGF